MFRKYWPVEIMADKGRHNLTNPSEWQPTDSEHTDSCSSSDEREPLHNSNQTYLTEAPYTPTHQGNVYPNGTKQSTNQLINQLGRFFLSNTTSYNSRGGEGLDR